MTLDSTDDNLRFLASASLAQVLGHPLSERGFVGSNSTDGCGLEYSNQRAVALGAAPAEHGRVSVEMSTIQNFLVISALRF
jgi:hypothetical protein